MYAGVPSETPTSVIVCEWCGWICRDSDSAFATPKSVTIAWRRLTNTLSGLMSR